MKSNCFKLGLLFLLMSTGCSNYADGIFKMKEVSSETGTGTGTELHKEYVRNNKSLSSQILDKLMRGYSYLAILFIKMGFCELLVLLLLAMVLFKLLMPFLYFFHFSVYSYLLIKFYIPYKVFNL